jgi:hypothetical protein
MVIAATGAVLAANSCAQSTTVHAKTCATVESHIRAADSKCEQSSTSGVYRWRYYTGGTIIPKVGGKLPWTSGTFNEPSGTVVRIPAKGGTGNEQAGK